MYTSIVFFFFNPTLHVRKCLSQLFWESSWQFIQLLRRVIASLDVDLLACEVTHMCMCVYMDMHACSTYSVWK